MYVSPCRTYAYLATPRTGSSSTAKFLLASGWQREGSHHQIRPNICAEIKHVYASVRNHHDTITSWYHFAAHQFHCPCCEEKIRIPFNLWLRDFLRDEVTHRYRKYFPAAAPHEQNKLFGIYTEHATGVIHFENLEANVRTAFGGAVRSDVQFPHRNPTPDKQRPYLEFYNATLFENVVQRFRNEMIELGYPIQWPGG